MTQDVVLVLSGTRRHYILDGQHKFSAAQLLLTEMTKAGGTLPQWLQRIHCLVVKQSADVNVRQQIDGRQQARSANVKQQSMGDRAAMFLRELEKVEGTPNRATILKAVYTKSGCVKDVDGSEVWLLSLPLPCSLA